MRDKTVHVETMRIGDELNVDLAPDGTIYGFELLNSAKQLDAGNGGLTIVNEAFRKSSSVPIPV